MEEGTTASGLLKDFARVDTADADDLVGRLDMMHSIPFFQHYKRETFELLDITAGSRVADVGCGTGEDARLLAERVGAEGCVVGFDASARMVEAARARHAEFGDRLRFEQAAAESLPVADESFDAVRTDRLYVHLPEPEAALREAVRVLRPGGTLVISEPDMASFWTATDHLDIGYKIARGVAASVDNPVLTRQLAGLFRDVGLETVRTEVRTLVSDDPRPAERLLNVREVIQLLIKTGDLTSAEAGTWVAEFEERTARGRFLGGLSFFIVSARKPA